MAKRPCTHIVAEQLQDPELYFRGYAESCGTGIHQVTAEPGPGEEKTGELER